MYVYIYIYIMKANLLSTSKRKNHMYFSYYMSTFIQYFE